MARTKCSRAPAKQIGRDTGNRDTEGYRKAGHSGRDANKSGVEWMLGYCDAGYAFKLQHK